MSMTTQDTVVPRQDEVEAQHQDESTQDKSMAQQQEGTTQVELTTHQQGMTELSVLLITNHTTTEVR